MTLRIENQLVTEGKRLTNRIVTMRSLSAIPTFAFRRTILPLKNMSEERQAVTYSGLGMVSDSDEHSFDYEPLGHAMVHIIDSLGGAFHDSGTFVTPEDVTSMALVEPYDIDLMGDDRIKYCPDWELKKGDLLCFLLNGHKEYHECTGIMGNSMLASHGKRYMLNQRFDMDYLDAFDEDSIDDVEVPYE